MAPLILKRWVNVGERIKKENQGKFHELGSHLAAGKNYSDFSRNNLERNFKTKLEISFHRAHATDSSAVEVQIRQDCCSRPSPILSLHECCPQYSHQFRQGPADRLAPAPRLFPKSLISSDQQERIYWRKPIHFSDTTMELPGFCGSYRTEVGSPKRQECRLILCRK